MKTIDKAITTSQEIIKLEEQKMETLKKLNQSLIIKSLWPEGIFPIKAKVLYKQWLKPPKLLYVLTDTNSVEKIFNIKDLPENIQKSLHCYEKIKHFI